MIRVLIADDHPFLLAGVQAVLEAAGMTVVAAVGDGNAALAAVAAHDPAVVVLDVNMPGRDGISVLQALREADDWRPVILLTAQLDDPQLVAALRAGVNGIVGKQGGSRMLAEAIGIVVQGGQAIAPDLLARALDASGRGGRASLIAQLTPRELALARAAGSGQRNREIAELLEMTEGAVKVALHRLYDKLGVSNRTELALLVRDSES
ncbi:response regulator transcription factor [Novosphingobium sp.]|uniref:response regulator n=1 Tax=Novosphingobium sp. TaxID=1874826 RepID=UPI00273744A0|nr:response regulator transcription factor [Novosphingobium sp.]MDP3908737.1 response regulator transcription factor [Novosphingobium sp.]